MSLRQRFVILALLATFAIAAAVATIVQLYSRSDVVREESANDAVDAMVSALGQVFDSHSGAGRPTIDERELNALASTVVAPQVDAYAGFCTRSAFVNAVSPGPRHEPRPPELPPDQRQFVEAVCTSATSDPVLHRRLTHPHDVVVVSARRIAPDLTAWALARVSTHPEEGPQLPLWLGMMALATLALAGLTVESIVALRRGASDLELSLFRLRDDLRAELPIPRAKELARISEGLRSMAHQLADGRDRELSLERVLSHEQRLAGLGRVTAGVAHEIRNPLAAIKLKLDGLARRSLDQRSHDDVGICLHEVGRLDDIIGAMLLVARKSPAQKETIALGDLIDERTTLLREAADVRGVKLSRSGEGVAIASRVTVTRVLDNLLRNAIEASPSGGEVSVVVASGSDGTTLDVRDDGPGVAPERAGELFEPFFTMKPEGTGLGLWLSRSLLEIDAGTLAYARDGEHTHFRVTLPAPSDPPDADHPYR